MIWIENNLDVIWECFIQHVTLVLPALLLGILLSLLPAWIAYHYRWSKFTLVTCFSLLYAIPSLPLLVVLPTIFGTTVRSKINVVIALTIYAMAILVRAIVAALDSVPNHIILSAKSLGFSKQGRFFKIELPLAGPGILAGARVASISSIALVTVSAVLGVKSLGYLFTNGFQRGITEEVLTGIVLTVILALTVDRLLVWVGKILMPWTRKQSL